MAAIQRYVGANKTANACAKLRAFVHEVDAQTGKKITPAQAALFVSQAHDIKAALGC